MLRAENLNFDYNDEGILHVGTPNHREALKMSIDDGNSVSLKKKNIDIEVQNIKQTTEDLYCGKVQYVEPYQALLKDGIDDGVDICFSYKHIFACRH